jgi:uncharacterized protein YyaL (SSP411 family)
MKPNRLIHESSPYLQQHAHNPVDWHPWGEEALEKAKKEDKPILVSIGYSTCHWCHVMERESFEDENVAAYMNEHFINIKVDREERPDVDAIYMEAVQLIQNGQGGWPLNCFLTPDARPFFGGTYFPPKPAHRRASWIQVLANLKTAFTDRREEVEAQAKKVLHYIQQSQDHFSSQISVETNISDLNETIFSEIFNTLGDSFDGTNGGFGGAPKFPGTMALRFCLNHYQATRDEKALEHLLLSLDKMAMGGIYDQLKGGFARYTVDEAWLVPHFEKMLYDNALLLGLLADTYKLKPKQLYYNTMLQTMEWIADEMTSEEGLFYSALDADSEGVEGKFYVWSKAEIDELLGEKSPLFCDYYDISNEGNWEHSNILNVVVSLEIFCEKKGLDASEFSKFLSDCTAILLERRTTRIRPGLDDKTLLDWNAMMVTACFKVYQATQIQSYKERGERALNLLLERLKVDTDQLYLYHNYKDGIAKNHAFLDDYALLIEALLEAYTSTQNSNYKKLAKDYTDFVVNEFLDFKDNLFYLTSAKQKDILYHKKIVYDSATPCGNSTMVHNLQKVAILFGENSYREQAQKTLLGLRDSIERYPQSFGRWANALFLELYPIKTIAIAGKEKEAISLELLSKPLWNTLFLEEKGENAAEGSTSIVVCKAQTCHLPVNSVAAAWNLLEN